VRCESHWKAKEAGVDGNRTLAYFSEKTARSESGGAECGAVAAPDAVFEADLDWLTSVWPGLPADVRESILALARDALNGL
jgi:hypothetical protein